MSVQAGIWSFDGPVDREVLTKISAALVEYGPDAEATHCDGPVTMLYRPFHTVFESRVERQPHISSAGMVITWDGRLDNRDELILQLENSLKVDRTDVAIVAAAFDRWGTDCFARLIGDWALAVWNPVDRELLLSRDYIGIRHLFYHHNRHAVVWCTHLAPLVTEGHFTLSDEYIAGYLTVYPKAHLTPYREIQSVPPGQFARIRQTQTKVQSYWAFNPGRKIRYKTDLEYEERFRHLFRQAVRRRLATDSPVLAELSGGLDSSSIVCMADDILRNKETPACTIDTFSFWDRNEPGEDDFVYYKRIETIRGRPGHNAEIEGVGDSFSFKQQHFSAIPDFGARRELKDAQLEVINQGKYRVVLSGIGGDELLGQALNPRVLLADLLAKCRVAKFAEQLTKWSMTTRRPWIQLFFQTAALLLPTSLRMRSARGLPVDSWINSNFAKRHGLSAHFLDAAEGSWLWLPSVRDAFQTIMTFQRQMTFIHPSRFEIRYPFLDQTLAEFLLAIPSDQLARPGERRSLMRRALSNLLPPEIASRQTKGSTGRCIAATLNKHWTLLDSDLSALLSARLQYIDSRSFVTALTHARDGQIPLHFVQLMRALSLEFWLREAVARSVISTTPFTDYRGPTQSPQATARSNSIKEEMFNTEVGRQATSSNVLLVSPQRKDGTRR